jgi:hypothetical protein
MSELDQLPVDQHAALSLLLGRGMTYAAVAGLLALDAETVRDRAMGALAGLAPAEGQQLSRERRGEIGDYLLGQQPASQRVLTRHYLSTFPAARGWARIVAEQLSPLSHDLPDIPPEGRELALASALAAQRASAQETAWRTSRRGGMLALAAVGVLVAVVIVVVVQAGKSSRPTPLTVGTATTSTTIPTHTVTTAATSPTGTATVTTQPAARIVAVIEFAPPGGSGAAGAFANVLSQGTQRGFDLRAHGLAPTRGLFTYAVWLYNSETDALPLGFIAEQVTANGRAKAVGVLPPNAVHYRELIITREHTSHPLQPGPIVLAGPLLLGAGEQAG